MAALNVFKKYKRQAFIPLLIIVVGIGAGGLLIAFKPQVEKRVSQAKLPVVTIQQVYSQDVRIPVYSRGTIKARTDIMLTSEVQGRVQEISPNFSSGGFFEKGALLLKIDPINYELDLAKVKSQVAKAKLNLVRVEADVRTNRLSRSKVGLARIAEAKSALDAAKADVRRVKLLLARTEIRAPFSGRVLEKSIGVGQNISPGMQIGRIFATDHAQIHLPLSDAQMALVDIPYQFAGNLAPMQGPQVILRGEYGEANYFWQGRITGTEGGVNARNRLSYIIASISKPFASDPDQPKRPPLTVGKFIEAEIEGAEFKDTFILPREALHNTTQILTLDKDQRISIKDIEILYRGRDNVYIKSGLNSGDFVVLTPMDVVVDGMRVLLSEPQSMDSPTAVKKSNSIHTRLSQAIPADEKTTKAKQNTGSVTLKETLPPAALPEN